MADHDLDQAAFSKAAEPTADSAPNGVPKDEIVELFLHLEAYAGAARAFDSYQVALQVFAESPV